MEDCAIFTPIEVIESKPYEYNEWKICKTKITPPLPLPKEMCVGIDPGTVNFGLCLFMFHQVIVYQVKLKRDKDPVVRMKSISDLLSHIINFYEFETKMCIEGASYGDIYRQVELAEIRAACVFWALQHGMDVKIAQPSEIRKAVFGNGTIKAKELWKGILSSDAADALGCAYFAGQAVSGGV